MPKEEPMNTHKTVRPKATPDTIVRCIYCHWRIYQIDGTWVHRHNDERECDKALGRR